MTFLEKWLTLVEKKNSVLCAGLDPPGFALGRGDKGLPQNADKHQWCRNYLDAVHPFCTAVKFNIQYWKEPGDMEFLKELYSCAPSMELVVIEDSKIADIGSSNDAGLFSAAARADAVTIAPFGGNMLEAAEQKDKREIALITLCLMSNQEYQQEKQKLVPIENSMLPEGEYISCRGRSYIEQYLYLVREARKNRIDGIVLGAPSSENHISYEEIEKTARLAGPSMTVLCPGVGAQGGSAEILFQHFGRDRVIVNCSRSLMFPRGSLSNPREQREAARYYQELLNEQRG